MSVVEELISNGADVNSKSHDGFTVLMWVARNSERAEIISVLIDAGAEIDAQDPFGNVALGYAANFGHKSNIEALLSRGADKTIADEEGDTPRDDARVLSP
ncbi:hypothetical protein BSKO_04613 [Bryopsis sp. KO-2023]|nr:hypothetical protein BSKO_04613 [Bryopsis sp. KO-2023]